jgi:ATP-dependent protease ClpP protease subunit
MTYKYKATRHNHDEDEDDQIIPPQLFGQMQKRLPYTQFEYKYTAREIHFYISEDIGNPELYIEMIHTLNTATPNDVIYMHLNTSGGQLDTGVQIINAMKNSPAKVVTVLECMAHSLGTLLFLSGEELIVNDHCVMMFHNFRGGVIGKGNELTSQLNATVEWFTALAEQIYIPFLSKEEFQRIIKGEDIWMQSSEIRTRLENVVKVKTEEEKPEEVVEKPARKGKKLPALPTEKTD